MNRLTAAVVAALTAVTAVTVVSAVTADSRLRPMSEVQYVTARPGESFASIRRDLRLTCSLTELWAFNDGQTVLLAGAPVLIPPSCTQPVTTTTTTTTSTTTVPAQIVPPVWVGATIDRRTGESWAQATAAFERAIGADVDLARRFTGVFPQTFANVPAFTVDTGQRDRWISVKGYPTRADWLRFLRSIPADGHTTYVTINHEPENDGPAMTPTVYKAKQALMLAAIREVDRADLIPAVVLMGWLERDGLASTSSADWFPDEPAAFVLGLDIYENGSGRNLGELAAPTVTLWRAAGGGDFAIAETGTRLTGAQGVAWIDRAFAWCRAALDCLGITWFHSAVGPTGNWWLTDPLMQRAFGAQAGRPR